VLRGTLRLFFLTARVVCRIWARLSSELQLTLSRRQANRHLRLLRRAGLPVRLHLGCGQDRREGWLNIDVERRFAPDVSCDAGLRGVFEPETVDEIESCHLFEHFTYTEAITALCEWHRILKAGGKLSIEMPNLQRCVEILANTEGGRAEDFAMMGLFGQIPGSLSPVDLSQIHKYGWTPEKLFAQLHSAGFIGPERTPVTQQGRAATAFDRDMRVECRKPNP
jgi:hypothetical protein